MSIIQSYNVTVQWCDCEPDGIVLYPNFYKWMDSAQWSYFNKIKQPITKLEKIYGIVGLPLVHTEANYISACYREDILKIETRLIKITKSTIKLAHVIKRKNIEGGSFGFNFQIMPPFILVKTVKLNRTFFKPPPHTIDYTHQRTNETQTKSKSSLLE